MKYDDPINYTLNFKKILNFYVFNCVVPEVTQRDYSLEKYGWNDTKKLERELKKVSCIGSGNWKSCQTVDEVQNYINDNNIVSFSCIFSCFACSAFNVLKNIMVKGIAKKKEKKSDTA